MSEGAPRRPNSGFVNMLLVYRGGSVVSSYVGERAGGMNSGVCGEAEEARGRSQRLGKTRPLTQPPPAAAAITHKRFSSYCFRRRFCRGCECTWYETRKQQRHTPTEILRGPLHDAVGLARLPRTAD